MSEIKPLENAAVSQNQICLGDVIETRKPHPCGSNRWTVIRTGADIKIRCHGCGHIVMLDREAFLKRRKKTISRAETTAEVSE